MPPPIPLFRLPMPPPIPPPMPPILGTPPDPP